MAFTEESGYTMTVLSLNSTWRDLTNANDVGPLVIGLVNNMPDAALRSTERQFRDVLAQAAGRRAIVLRIFSIPGLARSEAAQQHVVEFHEDINELWGADLDGLIVTGTEPKAIRLSAEPHWPTLTKLVGWAADHTISTIWSCLAAHAAVHCLDGVERHPCAGGKLSGVFECLKTTDYPLLPPGPVRWNAPHSRCNELREDELEGRGYQILGRSPGAGVDMFAKSCNSAFLFLQGHPEYDAGALQREYRRDIGRYLTGARDTYPEMPRGYFDEASDLLLAYREAAMQQRDIALLAHFPAIRMAPHGRWHDAAVRLYGNWLAYLAAEKSAGLAVNPTPTVEAAPMLLSAHG